MHDAGHNVPPENERTHPDGQDGPNGPDGPDGRGRGQGKVQGQAADDTIRLNWREKLVEVGLFGAVIVSGMMIGSFIILFSLIYLHRTLEDFAPGFAEAGSIPFVFLVVLCAAIGNAVSFSCAPYLMRLIFRGYELKDERVDRALERLRTVTGMDIRPDRIYAIKGKTVNAVVAGLFRKAQYIFVTNRLLERMNEGEIMAVLAHELAHRWHRHMPRFWLVIVLWALGVHVLLWLIDYHAYIETLRESWKLAVYVGVNFVYIYLLMFLVLFPLSRRHEYQADATAARWVGVSRYKQFLYRLHQLNDRLKPPRKVLAKLGTHPTLQERVEHVGRLE